MPKKKKHGNHSEILTELRNLRNTVSKQEQEMDDLRKIVVGSLAKTGRLQERSYYHLPSQGLMSELVSPAMQDTIKAVKELGNRKLDADADKVSKVTRRSKQRESQYLSYLSKINALKRIRKGKKVYYTLK